MKYKKEKNEIPKSNYGPKEYFAIGILLVMLIVTNFGTYLLGASREKKANLLDLNFLNPARSFFSQKDLIINFQPLRDYFDGKYEQDRNVSIYFEYLSTGASITVNKDAEFFPASLFKVPVAMAAVKKIDKGEWKWDNKLVLMSTDKDDKFGTLYKEKTGSIFTIEELVRRSLVDSDNTAHFILLRNLELTEINDVYTHIGLIGFLQTNGDISAKRYSVILRSLYNASYLTEKNSQKFLAFLTREEFREYLGSGMPADVMFAHKIGIDINKKIYLDSGIVYFGKRPYLLVVMTKDKNEQQAKDIMKDISEKTFNYIKDYND